MDKIWVAVASGLVAGLVTLGGAIWDSRRLVRQLRHDLDMQQARLRHELELQQARLRHEFELQEVRLKEELRTEYMAESAIHALLIKAEPKRSFERIKARVGGFDDPELRRLLVRSGALRYEANDGTELWGLRDRNEI